MTRRSSRTNVIVSLVTFESYAKRAARERSVKLPVLVTSHYYLNLEDIIEIDWNQISRQIRISRFDYSHKLSRTIFFFFRIRFSKARAREQVTV